MKELDWTEYRERVIGISAAVALIVLLVVLGSVFGSPPAQSQGQYVRSTSEFYDRQIRLMEEQNQYLERIAISLERIERQQVHDKR